jgi:hypothetical protein
MKRFLTILMAGLLIASFTAPASAVELELKGTWLWGYDYIDQAGRAGFFGPYDFSAFTTAGAPKFNAMNAFLGFRTINGIQYGMVTGADGSLQWSRMELLPSIRLNKAMRFSAWYQIGNGTNEYGLYANSTAFGAWNPIASGTWTGWSFTTQLPWGTLVAGKRMSWWGLGLNRGYNNFSTEQLTLFAPYGPVRVGIGFFPWRGNTWDSPTCNTGTTPAPFDRQVLLTTGGAGPQLLPGSTISLIQLRLWDKDRVRNFPFTIAATYMAGNVDTGIRYDWRAQHNGPGGATSNGVAGFALTFDFTKEDGSWYFKYNNGRFFFNTEIAWIRGQQRVQQSQVPVADPGDGGGHPLAPNDYEVWKCLFELGAMSGPAKLSFLYSWTPGPDRRHGIWIHNQTWEMDSVGRAFSTATVWLPYSLLMGYQYGAGVNALNRNGEGLMSDAISYGARLDYAVAANLNLYGTFFYANRQSHGWPWGIITPAADTTNGGGRAIVLGVAGKDAFGPTNVALLATQNNFLLGAPNVPDDNLGWEVTFGADWKILEGLTMCMRGAYWEVGNWFKYACVDRSLANTVSSQGGISFLHPYIGGVVGGPMAVNPNRAIDPIWMFQGVMVVDF